MKVLHLYLDEPGGGPVHVGLLRSILARDVDFDAVPIDPSRLHRSPLGWSEVSREILSRIGPGPTIIHAHGIRAASAALWPARRSGSTLAVTIHGLHSLRRANRFSNPLVRSFNRFVLHSADRVLVLGESDRALLARDHLVSPERVRRIHAACRDRIPASRQESRNALGLPQDAKVVLWLGRLAPEKAPLEFLRVMDRLEGVIGLVVGDGPLREQMESRDRANVRMTGWMHDPGPAFDAANLFVSTSRWEGLPVAALEAAASGLPFVLTDCPGNRDLVSSGIPGTLVPAGDQSAMASAISTLLGDREGLAQLGARVRDAAAGVFSAERLRFDLLETYSELLAG